MKTAKRLWAEVTDKCNSHCASCSIWRSKSANLLPSIADYPFTPLSAKDVNMVMSGLHRIDSAA